MTLLSDRFKPSIDDPGAWQTEGGTTQIVLQAQQKARPIRIRLAVRGLQHSGPRLCREITDQVSQITFRSCRTRSLYPPQRWLDLPPLHRSSPGHDAGKIPSQCWFYCWMTRVLLERVTRFVLDHAMMEHGEPRFLGIEYSARGGLKYTQMKAYYEWLRMKRVNPFLPWGKICFKVMHQNLLRVYPHLEREGLQLADTVTSAFFKACDKYDTGGCDPQYAMLLRERMAREPDNHRGKLSGYGLKLLPNFARANLDPDQAAIFRYYGYPSQWWDPEAFSG
jgi:hypothetical protein